MIFKLNSSLFFLFIPVPSYGGKKGNFFRNPTVIQECFRHINLPFLSVYSFSCMSCFLWVVSRYRETMMAALGMGCPCRCQCKYHCRLVQEQTMTAKYARKCFSLFYLGNKQYWIFTKLECFKKLACGTPDFVLLLLTFCTL